MPDPRLISLTGPAPVAAPADRPGGGDGDPHLGRRTGTAAPAGGAERPGDADLHSHDDAARTQRAEEEADETRIGHERRDERHFIRVPVPFSVEFTKDNRVLRGGDLSLGGFSVRGENAPKAGAVAEVSLLIAAGPAQLIVPATARAIRSRSRNGGQETAFEITEIDQRHREVLRRVIRTYLSGRYAALEDMVDDEDPQTPRKRSAAAAAAAAQAGEKHDRRPKPWGRYLALGAAAAVLLAVVGATAYRNFMLIEPDFAAVTAPRVDIRAPGSGVLAEHNLEAGDRVNRDDLLVRVVNSDLRTDLMLARAAYRYNERLIENVQERLNQPQVEKVSMAETAAPPEDGPVKYSLVDAEIARARIDEFQTARDFEVSKIAALEARMAANDVYSPCNCLVAWARSAAGGSYIGQSERIITLIETGDDDLLVEALVHMSQIDRIEPHQRAFVALPNASEPIEARVHAVSLDVERQPRAGFPKWVRQQQNIASVLLVPEQPLPASAVGVPVDVRFSEAPVLDEAAEWVWQGGRAAIQTAGRAAGAAWREISGAVDEAAEETGIPIDRTDPPAEPRERAPAGGSDQPATPQGSGSEAGGTDAGGTGAGGQVPEQTAAVPDASEEAEGVTMPKPKPEGEGQGEGSK
ncbi:HlyD family efflux transporter periplasmic adaptor subunit [Caenispirillum salinarum]|uniref:HlyD family efflux transporter periplasmic adaptor subunit n=1 Tax=Caenispirillum salinarum TaxID=859058 RepID=UPI00384E98F7